MTSKKEIWKAHPYIGIIEVSNFGRVRTLDKIVSSNGRGTYLVKGRVLKPGEASHGYLRVDVKVDGKWTKKKVHRLVAQTFLSNPDNLPMVNHKDCNRKNNNVENLEWCTASYNQQYREKFGNALSKPVFAVNLSTLKVSRFSSQVEASRSLGVGNGNISRVIKGSRNKAGGYWFVNDDGHAVDVVKSKLHDIGGTGLKIKQGR